MKLKATQTQTSHYCQAGHLTLKSHCPECKKLRAEWYQYLENSGFIDIEDSIGLKDRGSQQALERKTEVFHAQQNYYQWARSKLNDGNFSSERDKLIWEYHAEGLSSREVAPRVGLEDRWVRRKVNYIKTYLKESYDAIGSLSLSYGTQSL